MLYLISWTVTWFSQKKKLWVQKVLESSVPFIIFFFFQLQVQKCGTPFIGNKKKTCMKDFYMQMHWKLRLSFVISSIIDWICKLLFLKVLKGQSSRFVLHDGAWNNFFDKYFQFDVSLDQWLVCKISDVVMSQTLYHMLNISRCKPNIQG
jgi:hypothetical protein